MDYEMEGDKQTKTIQIKEHASFEKKHAQTRNLAPMMLNKGEAISINKEGQKMENQVICPSCKKTISNNPIIDAAAVSTGTASQAIICECGERITFWQIKAQLRDQKTMGWKFRNWVRSLSHGRN